MPLPPSASDWIRFQKLKSAIAYNTTISANTDIQNVVTPAGCNPCLSNRQATRTDIDRVAGSSRTRREASKWIDFVASRQTDFITVSEMPNNSAGQGFGRQLNRTQICANNVRCVTTAPFQTGWGIRRPTYQHLRL